MNDRNKPHPNVAWIEDMAGRHRPVRPSHVEEATANPAVTAEGITEVAKPLREQVRAAYHAGVTIEQLVVLYPNLKAEWIEGFCTFPEAPGSVVRRRVDIGGLA